MTSEVNEPAPPSVLDIHELSVAYGGRTVVDGVSFQIHRGEIFGLLSPNGAGKTSTLSAIEGLVRPKSGRLPVDGVDVQRQPLDAKARLGVQLQSSSFQAKLSIDQIARLYVGLDGVKLPLQQIRESMRTVGLGEELGNRFKQLSGGQQQRLARFIDPRTLRSPGRRRGRGGCGCIRPGFPSWLVPGRAVRFFRPGSGCGPGVSDRDPTNNSPASASTSKYPR
ncbi:MAG: ATP-binding cassette domain-containing protein [Actinomycetota bacterium]|nr:ATP-binding cassette domain-containing protein [Actinomycetota bacterium]